MIQLRSLFLLLMAPFICCATDLKPWFGNDYEAELRVTTLFQSYDSLQIPNYHPYAYFSNDTFTTLSAIYPFKRYSGEFEITGAHTHHQSHCIDNYRITGRYKWLDDIENRFSLVTSITLGEPMTRALNDVSSFHHGHIEGEACVSFGKKYGFPCSKNYIFRWWNVIGIGIAEEGSTWYRTDAAWEWNFRNRYQLRGFVNMLWGTGKNNLNPHGFRGYGSIRHQSIDFGIRYAYTIVGWGTLNFQYARRVYAYNFPENTNLLLFEYYYPFGTQVHTSY